MKKLMLAAAIVCAAVMAHAAAVTWEGAIYLEDFNGDPGIGTIEFFLNGNSLGVEDAEGYLEFAYDLTVPGTVSALATVTNFGESGDITGTKSWSFDVTQAWLDSQPEGTAGGTLGGMVAEGVQLDYNHTLAEGPAAHGYTSAVPEPTSGLLLLLGVAGLALRRRRA